MFPSLPLMALAALSTLPHVPGVGAASSGPKQLKECTYCEPIYTTMVKCQTIKRPGGIGKEITNCICVPNPDGWYPYLHKCRDCLSGSDFYDNLARMITQLFTSCTNNGGNVVSDGQSICASNAMWEYCASLNDGSDGALSWASFTRFSDASENSNATQLLYLDAPNKGSASTVIASVTSTTSTTTSATSTRSQVSSATTSVPRLPTLSQPPPLPFSLPSSTPTTAASESRATASTAPSSAARLGYGPQLECLLGMLAAAAFVHLLV